MPVAHTITGSSFEYSGSLETGLTVHKGVDIWIPRDTIDLIKEEITRRSPVLMGACRDNPTPNSVGRALYDQSISPQVLSYVVPLLVAEGFCTTNGERPILITRTP